MYCDNGFIYFGHNFRYGFAPSFRTFLYDNNEMWPLSPALALSHEVVFEHMTQGVKSGVCQDHVLRKLSEKISIFGGIEDENDEAEE